METKPEARPDDEIAPAENLPPANPFAQHELEPERPRTPPSAQRLLIWIQRDWGKPIVSLTGYLCFWSSPQGSADHAQPNRNPSTAGLAGSDEGMGEVQIAATFLDVARNDRNAVIAQYRNDVAVAGGELPDARVVFNTSGSAVSRLSTAIRGVG